MFSSCEINFKLEVCVCDKGHKDKKLPEEFPIPPVYDHFYRNNHS